MSRYKLSFEVILEIDATYTEEQLNSYLKELSQEAGSIYNHCIQKKKRDGKKWKLTYQGLTKKEVL